MVHVSGLDQQLRGGLVLILKEFTVWADVRLSPKWSQGASLFGPAKWMGADSGD